MFSISSVVFDSSYVKSSIFSIKYSAEYLIGYNCSFKFLLLITFSTTLLLSTLISFLLSAFFLKNNPIIFPSPIQKLHIPLSD
ncbi:MAG: hypothetical protein E7207_05310 [Clostridium butyricum]|nr:hypothetical protein [Clostridium butyricum]